MRPVLASDTWDPAYRGLLAAGDSGYIVANPEMLAGPGSSRVNISPDGRFILTLRYRFDDSPATLEKILTRKLFQSTEDEVQIIVWDVRTRRATIIARLRPEAGTVRQFLMDGWFAGGAQAVIAQLDTITNPDGKKTHGHSVLVVDAVNARLTTFPMPPESNYLINPSPTIPYGVLMDAEGSSDKTMQFVKPDGTVTAPIAIPGFLHVVRWSPDGTTVRCVRRNYLSTGTTEDWFAIDPRAGTVTPIPAQPRNAKGELDYGPDSLDTPADLPLRLVATKPDPSLLAATAGPLWLEATEGGGRVLLSAEGEPIALTWQAAIYRSAGALYIAPLHKISRPVYNSLAHTVIRQKTLNAAEEISLSLFMYWHDHDKMLPSRATDLKAALASHLSPASLEALSRFTYEPPTNLFVEKIAGLHVGTLTADDGSGKVDVLCIGRSVWSDTRK